MDPLPSQLLVRWLHRLVMAVAVGGAALAWGVSRVGAPNTTVVVSRVYEPASWGRSASSP